MSDFEGLDVYDTDSDKESEVGVEIPLNDGISINVLRAGGSNKKYARAFYRITAPYQRRMNSGQLDDDTSDRLMMEVYAESIVVSWKGIRRKGDTEDLPCTKENIMNLFKGSRNVFTIVKEVANDLAQFQLAEAEAQVEPLGN